jgi:hypothetical protein
MKSLEKELFFILKIKEFLRFNSSLLPVKKEETITIIKNILRRNEE